MARQQQRSAQWVGVWEVLTRQGNGHETVHRVEAADEPGARAAVEALGVPGDQVVSVTPPTP